MARKKVEGPTDSPEAPLGFDELVRQLFASAKHVQIRNHEFVVQELGPGEPKSCEVLLHQKEQAGSNAPAREHYVVRIDAALVYFRTEESSEGVVQATGWRPVRDLQEQAQMLRWATNRFQDLQDGQVEAIA